MFLGKVLNISSGAVLAPIPFVTSFNTNNKTNNKDGVIELRKPGIYNIDVIVEAALPTGATSQSVTAELFTDGNATITESSATVDAGELFTLVLTDAVRVEPDVYPNVATVDIRLNVANVEISSATLRVEYLQ